MGRVSILASIIAKIKSSGTPSITQAVDVRDVLNEMADNYTSAIYDTTSNFTTNNPILETKQLAIESNTLSTSPKFKIGDGVTHWNILPYASSGSSSQTLEQTLANGNTSGANDIIVEQELNMPNEQIGSILYIDPSGNVKNTLIQSNNVELKSNKANTMTGNTTSNILFLSAKAIYDWATGLFELTSNKQNSLAVDGTGNKYVTVDAVNSGLATKQDTILSTVGNIINESHANLSAWTQVGTSFTASSGVFNISATVGTVDFTNYIKNNYGKSDLENTTTTGTIKVGTINSTSFGVGVGFYSQRSTFPKSLTVGFLMDSTNSGRIAFYFNNSSTGAVLSNSKITIASGDTTTFTIRQVKDTFIVTWINGISVNTLEYTFFLNNVTLNPTIVTNMPNAYNYTVYALGGGTHQLSNYKVYNDEIVKPDILFIGDSLIKGYSCGDIGKRAISFLSEQAMIKVSSLANGGNWIEDVNVAEVLTINPSKIVISSGINNLEGGDSNATLMSKLGTLINSFISNGYIVGTNLFVTTLRPYAGRDVTSYNNLLRTAYPNAFIELYNPLVSNSGFAMNTAFCALDLLHLNNYGAKLESDIYMQYFGLKTKYKSVYNNNYVFSDNNGNTAFGLANIARYLIDVKDTKSQIRFGLSNNDDGGFLHSNAASAAMISGGLANNGSLYVYKASSYSAIDFDSGLFYFLANTGRTIGGTVASPNVVALMDSTGKMRFGSATTPHSTIQTNSFAAGYLAATVNYTATSGDYLIDCTNTITITLPTAIGITGRVYEVVNSGAGTITIATTSSQTFRNVSGTPTTLTIATALGKSIRVMSNGANWIQLN